MRLNPIVWIEALSNGINKATEFIKEKYSNISYKVQSRFEGLNFMEEVDNLWNEFIRLAELTLRAIEKAVKGIVNFLQETVNIIKEILGGFKL